MLHEIFVEVAYQCESRFHTRHVDQVDLEGGLKVHADTDSRTEYRAFVTCYTDGLKARADVRRKPASRFWTGSHGRPTWSWTDAKRRRPYPTLDIDAVRSRP